MILYGSTISPFVRKVAAFAAEKGLDLPIEMAGMGRGGPGFMAASPFGKMPAFQDDDFSICDSSAIVAYLDAKHPEPNLIPIDPRARARTIWYDEFADTILMAAGAAPIFGNRFVFPRLMNRPADLEAAARVEREELPKMYDYLEGIVPDSGFLVEDRLTLADIAVACPFVNLSYAGSPLDAAHWPRTHAYVAAILARPSFAMVRPDAAIIESMGGAVLAA